MLAAERRSIILQKVSDEGKVIVAKLSKEFDVSEETIRRDLEKLEEDGHVTRGYGGAVINEKTSIDLPFNIRWKANAAGKQKIAELVSNEIGDGEHIFLDASTTTVFIAKSIKQKKRLTVITNSVENIIELSDVEEMDIISTGGKLKAGSMSLLGKAAFDCVRSYNADKLFMSCKGIDMNKGITDGNDESSGIKQVMLDSAEKVYLVVDSTKFDKAAFSHLCEIPRIDVVVTDKKPANAWLELFDKNGIKCIYPEEV